MSSRLRDYEITVGSASEVFGGDPSQLKRSATASVVTNLQIEGSVSVSNDYTNTQSDMAQFKIYNLSSALKDQFKIPGAAIMIRAGYTDSSKRDESGEIIRDAEDLPVVYVGTIIHTTTTRRGNDVVTVVYASSDKLERAMIKTSNAFAPGVPVTAVIEYFLSLINMPRAHIDLSSVASNAYSGGLSVYGNAFAELQRVCSEWKLKLFVHDKQINIVPAVPNEKSTVEVWDIYSGDILDVPEQTYERTQTREKVLKSGKTPAVKELKPGEVLTVEDGLRTVTKNGLNFSVPLDGRIKVGHYVRLNDIGDVTGVYRVEKLSHSFTYIGGSWSTSLETIPV
ncbi:hypothetical protein [Buttiauxella noackiae]|uniref:hypothetical protein n=1 Tax=Buttiauxella noackiae TaxID=82992 RepID=UPI0005596D70|nr:hypothetical protein [Buttiauxella noackiae]